MMRRLENKIALITGASRGIGKAIAEVFHLQGATVILSDISNYEGIIVSEELGGKCEYLPLNVKLEQDWIEASQYIKTKYGKLDILVNNAGITGF
ncbi:MAG: SDR family NAD(P)-dependent oxidoreductase, partial [Flavobacterium sp.]|uniref:SDR family NAD(P)-dependent oxidoreductase n=1 Tax=Flavobacterium sp. TaxID=239 RepID=UPI0026134B18